MLTFLNARFRGHDEEGENGVVGRHTTESNAS
jgi:hypothetical protein